MIVDIGANLTSARFDKDLDQVINNAVVAGVEKIVVTGTSIKDSKSALTLTRDYPDVLYATAGIHPHHAKEFDSSSIGQLKDILVNPSVVAVGECGLDYNRNFSEPSDQRHCFEKQLELAAESGMPVFLHQRDAHQDFYKILSCYIEQIPAAVAHCFTGTLDEMQSYLEMGLSIGITGWICDERRGDELKSIVNQIPLDRLMIETDAPYLLPRSLKPKPKSNRNEPMYLSHICHTVAECYDRPAEEIAALTYDNSRRFFGF